MDKKMIARELVKVAKDLTNTRVAVQSGVKTAASKGTITVGRSMMTLRKVTGPMEVWKMANHAGSIESDFISDLEDVLGDAHFSSQGNIRTGDIMVMAYRSGPGIEITLRITGVSPEQLWDVAKTLSKKGYSVK
jgi:hypothetical protein